MRNMFVYHVSRITYMVTIFTYGYGIKLIIFETVCASIGFATNGLL